ncbi:GreA/GreB family elongation factor [Cellulosilyticum sp. I15G10I2]|uniref:GreA/GreB family elongation factor n=1 Tax=Cellulosilyticum sp. I15G10I2 TaxID=1892843 RepID=UPI00085BF906|nr:GreA/GreB family elongation factor [Cellulosilyticum sp. I15G10I2]
MSRQIFITQSDKDRLLELIYKAKYEDLKDNLGLQELEAEINRAVVTSVDQLPANVITMNTKVILLIEDAEEEFTLVYPNEADILQNKISVLSPIGTAILGYSEGSVIEWKVPDGIVLIEVKKVLFQPEALGLYHL